MPVGAPHDRRRGADGRGRSSHALKKGLHDAGHNTNVGDEGGFAPNLNSADEALALHRQGACEKAGYRPGEDVAFALDPRRHANSSRTANMTWKARARSLDAEGMVGYYADLAGRYPIVSIEDGCAEDDWDGWKLLTERAGRARCSWSATICSSPTRSACAAASRRAPPTPS